MSRKSPGGFTLLELMVVVGIIALLAALALPSFLAQVRKSRRSEAIATMNTVALDEEHWRAECPNYATFGDSSCAAPGTTFMATPTSTYYTFALSNVSSSRYTITATPTGNQAKDSQFGTGCNPMTLDYNAGVTSKTPSDCFGQH